MNTLLTSQQDSILTITMNRPERLNAWTYEMGAELRRVISAANEADDIEAMILTGAGRGFCAGADIQEVFKAQADGESTSTDSGGDGPRDWVQLIRSSKPIIAAVNGAAIGVGLTQILPMDYIVAARGAKFSVRFIKMGLVPELASSHFLTTRLGFGAASKLMLTGETIDTEAAMDVGLIDQMTEPEKLLDAAHQIASAMGENPQSAIRMVKQLMTDNLADSDLMKVQQRELIALDQCYQSPEHREAISAFLEKRSPDFKTARKSTL